MINHKLKRYKIIVEDSEINTPGDSVNSIGRMDVKLKLIYRHTKKPLKNRIITHKLYIVEKFIIFWTCPKEFCSSFFLSYKQRCTTILTSYCKWNLQLIN